MRRIRIALVLVSLATLGLVALLAWRASQGLAAERAVRHEAIAERAFEEMERALTDFLAREEARPFGHYAYYVPVSGARSPLAAGLEPFVVGAFQLDPEGALTTPLEPPDRGVARERGDWPPSDAQRVAARRVARAVDALWSEKERDGFDDRDAFRHERAGTTDEKERAGRLRDASAKQSADLGPAPGKTRAISGPGFGSRRDGDDAPADEPKQARNAFEVLESLNRAADDRAERKQKVARAPKAAVYGGERYEAQAKADASERPEAPEPALAGALAEARERRAGAAARTPLPAPAESAPAPAREGTLRGLGYLLEESRVASEREAVRVAIDPMVGVAAGDDLVLTRTVLVDRRGYRQGLVLDRAALGAWLEDRVIRSSGLAEVARLSFAGGSTAPGGERYLFAHRFAEPFDAVHAELALAPLPGVASQGALYALVGVLLAVGAAGLVAVHRMVSVAVHYAERRGNFVAAVTHELKTPLTAIRMYAEMLRDGLVPSDAKRREYYATITDESERLSRLVDNVLEFSKLEGGRRELSISVGEVGPVLLEAAEKLRAHAEREGFRIAVDVAPGLPAVRFDRDALIQVIFNLVDNAVKYAGSGAEKRIELCARRDGDAVSVSVRDFGPGVARGQQERMFEPFYRAESELTRTTKGTGIGLALVKELGERMGAAVSGANAEDGGLRVSLAFPSS